MGRREQRVLLVGDGSENDFLGQLTERKNCCCEFEAVDSLAEGLRRAQEGGFDIILLDLSLPDSNGLDTLVRAHAKLPEVPIIVLCDQDHQDLTLHAIERGAQDCFNKSNPDADLFERICYSIERHRALSKLRQLAVIDELTGLNNRRGFIETAEQFRLLADRRRRRLAALFIDLDGMKQINDSFGHRDGDMALVETAYLLRDTFRRSDVLGRLGGDEFVVLLTELAEPGDVAEVVRRLQGNVDARNKTTTHNYKLSLSVGYAAYEPGSAFSIEALIARADIAMYEQKMSKRARLKRSVPSLQSLPNFSSS